MIEEKTDFKCLGCKRELPDSSYDVNTRRAAWFGRYHLQTMIEWICVKCWDEGKRYTDKKVV